MKRNKLSGNVKREWLEHGDDEVREANGTYKRTLLFTVLNKKQDKFSTTSQ
ncbi:MAG TPA: hypothetical protein VKM55_12510 [Candidatus Lokiarchaeia archaeon]|nr:hypothetical protein [Candidatus Lokiarchaeia archaeon]